MAPRATSSGRAPAACCASRAARTSGSGCVLQRRTLRLVEDLPRFESLSFNAYAELVALDVSRHLGQRAARAATRGGEVVLRSTGDLEALASLGAEVHDEHNEHQVEEDGDDAVQEDAEAAAVGREVAEHDAVAAGLHEVAGRVKGGGEAAERELGDDDGQAHGESLRVGRDSKTRRDLRDRDARAERDHEAVRHERREAVPEADFPLSSRHDDTKDPLNVATSLVGFAAWRLTESQPQSKPASGHRPPGVAAKFKVIGFQSINRRSRGRSLRSRVRRQHVGRTKAAVTGLVALDVRGDLSHGAAGAAERRPAVSAGASRNAEHPASGLTKVPDVRNEDAAHNDDHPALDWVAVAAVIRVPSRRRRRAVPLARATTA
ncbi:hypothetical protein ON010_g2690 [Phytophthora cinnamomi]|nr:hypothetical protein ON010_g2690 [Phytophthora cinnamomi]